MVVSTILSVTKTIDLLLLNHPAPSYYFDFYNNHQNNSWEFVILTTI